MKPFLDNLVRYIEPYIVYPDIISTIVDILLLTVIIYFVIKFLIKTTAGRVIHSFRSFAKRRLHIIPLELDGVVRTTEISERAHRVLNGIPSYDIVRLELCGRYFPNLWKDVDALHREFDGRFYYFEVKDSSRIAINPEDYKHDMSLKGEFIRTVSADETLDQETKERIIACGINALMGEELFEG